MTKDELIAALQDYDIHIEYDVKFPVVRDKAPWEWLLDYIDDPEIRAAFESIPTWVH
jgi:hypothetical protein